MTQTTYGSMGSLEGAEVIKNDELGRRMEVGRKSLTPIPALATPSLCQHVDVHPLKSTSYYTSTAEEGDPSVGSRYLYMRVCPQEDG